MEKLNLKFTDPMNTFILIMKLHNEYKETSGFYTKSLSFPYIVLQHHSWYYIPWNVKR